MQKWHGASLQSKESSLDSSYSIVKRLFKDYILVYKGWICIAIFLMAIVSLCDASLILLVKPSLDGVFIEQKPFLFYIIPAFILGIALMKGLADYGQSYLIKSIGQQIVSSLQLDLYTHLIKSDMDFLNQQSSGHILSKFTNDIFNIRLALTSIVVNFAKDLFTVVLLVGVMFYNDYKLSLVTFFVFPIIILPILRYGKRMKKITHDTQSKLAEYTKYLNERLHNIKLIKAFCSEKYEIKESANHLNEILACYKKSIRIESIISPFMEVFSSVAIAAVILYGGYSVVTHSTTPGSLFSFISAFIVAYKPVKSLASMNMTLQAGVVSAKRILAILTQENVVERGNVNQSLEVKKGKIEFSKITFSYDKKRSIIHDLSLTIKPNQVVAIVGESGSGKSTLVDLLLKFYEPNSGKIYIDNQDLAYISCASIRKNISLVLQDTLLFDASIKDNIRYGQDHVTDEQIKEAAELAYAKEFIEHTPHAYDTMVGKFGIKLSGGQRQRIAIARALLRNAPILILDEATSSLDQSSERYVKDALLNLRHKYKVIIVITHRLSTIKSSDVIYVMKKGQLVEFGDHEHLLSKKGEYHRLYNKKILA